MRTVMPSRQPGIKPCDRKWEHPEPSSSSQPILPDKANEMEMTGCHSSLNTNF